jgi:hypothetical protein
MPLLGQTATAVTEQALAEVATVVHKIWGKQRTPAGELLLPVELQHPAYWGSMRKERGEGEGPQTSAVGKEEKRAQASSSQTGWRSRQGHTHHRHTLVIEEMVDVLRMTGVTVAPRVCGGTDVPVRGSQRARSASRQRSAPCPGQRAWKGLRRTAPGVPRDDTPVPQVWGDA